MFGDFIQGDNMISNVEIAYKTLRNKADEYVLITSHCSVPDLKRFGAGQEEGNKSFKAGGGRCT